MEKSEENKNSPSRNASTQSTIGTTAKSNRLFRGLKKWLRPSLRLTETRKAIVLDELIESAFPGMDFFVMIILSCTIATFGLIIDSPAVIIGAMLIAPLMSPILGLSMASVTGFSRMFRQSLIAILEGVGLSVGLSAFLSFLVYRSPYGPVTNIPNEVLSRTSPTLIDLGIALAGGAAAAYALAHPRLSAVLPGVAISTALMPPICTIGIGISLWNSSVVLGATLLFLTNLTAICFAGIITFALMGFGPRHGREIKEVERSLRISALLVLIIGILLGIFAWNTVTEAQLYNTVSRAILENASQFTESRLVDLSLTTEGEVVMVNAVLRTARELSYAEALAIQSDTAEQLERPVSLELVTVPMVVLDPLNPPTPTPTITPTPVRSSTPSPSLSPTLLPTETLLPTLTPVPLYISRPQGITIYAEPNGERLFELPQNAGVWVRIDHSETIDDQIWVQIIDMFNRSGWVPLEVLPIQLTPRPD